MSNTTLDAYRWWLRSAYAYYITPGADTLMPDGHWDKMAREFYEKRHNLDPDTYTALHHPEWTGGSLHFMGPKDYPSWAKTGGKQ